MIFTKWPKKIRKICPRVNYFWTQFWNLYTLVIMENIKILIEHPQKCLDTSREVWFVPNASHAKFQVVPSHLEGVLGKNDEKHHYFEEVLPKYVPQKARNTSKLCILIYLVHIIQDKHPYLEEFSSREFDGWLNPTGFTHFNIHMYEHWFLKLQNPSVLFPIFSPPGGLKFLQIMLKHIRTPVESIL